MGYKNKSVILGMMLFPISAMAGFIHPMDFDGSEAVTVHQPPVDSQI